MFKENVKTRKPVSWIAVAVLGLALFVFMMPKSSQGAVLLKAKVGPVTLKVGQHGHRGGHHHGSGYAVCCKPPRPAYKRCGTVAVVNHKVRRDRCEVWVPGHWRYDRWGHRYWVKGHWRHRCR